MRQGKVGKTYRVMTCIFFPHGFKVEHSPSLSLENPALFNMVAVNIVGWGYLINLHSYMMPQFNMYGAYPDIPSVTVLITET